MRLCKLAGCDAWARNGGVTLGCAFLLFLHFYNLGQVPGLHYDEAWAMNYSWRIGAGFWPVTAMSAYTAPWAHYWASLWMHLLGPSLLVFRSSQVTLSLLGLLALCFSLPKHVRAAFPWAVLLLPGLILNHRFAIELTGFHVLAFGALCWAIRREWYALACFAALAGTTAHILFYGVALALIVVVFLQGKALPKRARFASMTYFALMALFFLRVLTLIPEKGKAGALVFSSVALFGLLVARAETWPLWKSAWWRGALALGSAVFVFNCWFFGQGFWGVLLSSGFSPFMVPLVPYLFLVGSLGLVWMMARAWSSSPEFLRNGFLALTAVSGILMLKPAPRYFELSLLTLALLFSWNLSRWIYLVEWPVSKALRRSAILGSLLAVNLGAAFPLYFLLPTIDEPIHFLFFKDSSRDFLDKQSLALHLGSSGCSVNDIHSGDPRLVEELKALSLGNWPVNLSRPCAFNVVARRSEGSGPGELFGEFLLRRKP